MGRLTPYLVRVGRSHEVVGIFAATDLDHLAHLVDQCCDPAGLECLPVGEGGIIVPNPTTARWPMRFNSAEEPDPADEHPLDGAHLDECWHNACQEGDWQRVPPFPASQRSKQA